MADAFSIEMETRQHEALIRKLLDKVEKPRALMVRVQRYVNAVTMKMLRGRRADRSAIRGVKWPKLAPSTTKRKRALVKRGKAIGLRPMIRTGKMRDNIKVLDSGQKGFLFGTRVKGRRGFGYPGFHNRGKFPWLFLNRDDMAQMTRMIKDYLEDKLRSHKNYVR